MVSYILISSCCLLLLPLRAQIPGALQKPAYVFVLELGSSALNSPLKFRKACTNSIVFPNVGFTIVTIELGSALMSEGVLWLGSVMAVLLVVMWLFVGGMHIRAVLKGDILWPGKDEDHDQ